MYIASEYSFLPCCQMSLGLILATLIPTVLHRALLHVMPVRVTVSDVLLRLVLSLVREPQQMVHITSNLVQQSGIRLESTNANPTEFSPKIRLCFIRESLSYATTAEMLTFPTIQRQISIQYFKKNHSKKNQPGYYTYPPSKLRRLFFNFLFAAI